MTRKNPARPSSGPTVSAEERGVGPYVTALAVGIPTTLLMLFLPSDRFFGPLPLALATASGLGSTLALVGVRSRPRRFRTSSLLLTLIPGAVTIAGFAVFVVLLVVFVTTWNPNP